MNAKARCVLGIALLLPAPLLAQAPPRAATSAFHRVSNQSAPAPQPNRTRGALWGGGIGLVAGGVLGGLSVDSGGEDDFGASAVEGPATAEAVLIGAAVGAALGALLGATVFAPSRGPAAAPGPAGLHLEPLVSAGAFGLSGRLPLAGGRP